MPMRVGILTLPLDPNYGGMMQIVALYAFLSRNGVDVVFMNKREHRRRLGRLKNNLVARIPFGVIRATAGTRLGQALRAQAPGVYDLAPHRSFLRRYMPKQTAILHDPDELRAAVERHGLGAVVVGSDQIWNYGLNGRDGVDVYFCGFLGDSAVKRVAYAASFGHDEWRFPHLTDAARINLAKFAAVSVREASGVRICAEAFGRDDAVHVLDPTMLLRPDFYATMTAGVAAPKRPTVLEYILDPDADKGALTAAALAALGEAHAVRALSASDGVDAVDLPHWVAAFRDADFVLTDSFHGTVFSIMFRKNFISVVNADRGADRFHSLLNQLGLGDRLISRTDVGRVPSLVRAPPDFEPAHRRIDELRAASAEFLLSALR